MGSVPIAVLSLASEPASSTPNTMSTMGAALAPKVVHHTTPPLEARRGR